MVRTKNADWRMSAFLIELQNSFLFLSRTRKYECDAQKASSTRLAWVADDLCSSDESALPGVARQLLTFLASPVCVKLVVAFSIRDRITESDLALCSNTHGLAIANCACPQTIVEDTYV